MDKSINFNLRITQGFSVYDDELEMDSSEFEKIFNVYTSNKIKGMQILTADIMEDILHFKDKTKQDFDIFIKNNNIYLRFDCGSMFEPAFTKNKNIDKKILELDYNILKFVYELSIKIINVINETEL